MHKDVFHKARSFSNASKTYRIWHLKGFKNLDFFNSETWMLLVSPIISEGLMGIKETHYGICLQWDKASVLEKKLLLPGLLDGMQYELDMQNPEKSGC